MSRTPHLYSATFAFILNKEGKVLLLQRKNTGYCDGARDLPAGHVEDGETAIQSMCHECLEEIGITIDINESNIFHIIHRLYKDRQYIDIGVRITQRTGEITLNEPEKCSGIERYSFDQLPKELTPSTIRFIEAYQNKTLYSEMIQTT